MPHVVFGLDIGQCQGLGFEPVWGPHLPALSYIVDLTDEVAPAADAANDPGPGCDGPGYVDTLPPFPVLDDAAVPGAATVSGIGRAAALDQSPVGIWRAAAVPGPTLAQGFALGSRPVFSRLRVVLRHP